MHSQHGKDMVVKLCPTDLKGWVPANPLGHDKKNEPWVEDIRFSQLAEFHSHLFMQNIAPWIGWKNIPLADMKVALHKRRQDGIADRAGPFYVRESPSKPNGFASFKRYVQVAPWNYHANYCQFYIESFFEGADANDEPESKKPYLNPVVQPNEMVTFIGIYCGRKEMLDWNAEVMELDEDVVYAHHDRINELIYELKKIDCSKFSSNPPFVHTDDDEIRFRIQLPRQSLNQGTWNEDLQIALKALSKLVLDAFADIALERISP